MIGPNRPGPVVGAVQAAGAAGTGPTWTATAGLVVLSWDLEALWSDADPGLLVWDTGITAGADVTATWRLACGRGRALLSRGPAARLSATLTVRPSAGAATAVLSVACTVGTVLSVGFAFSQRDADVPPVTLALPGFGEVSDGGVSPPPPSAGLPTREALSPARRSPQVRAAQRRGMLRPDLLDRQSSLK